MSPYEVMLAKSALFALGNKLQKSLQTFLGGPPDLEATAVSRAQVSTALTSTLVHERSDEHRRRSRRGDHRHLYTVKAVTTSSCPLPHTGRGSLPRGWRNPTELAAPCPAGAIRFPPGVGQEDGQALVRAERFPSLRRHHGGRARCNWLQPSMNSNGNTIDLEGRLITCEHTGRRVTRTEHDGTITVDRRQLRWQEAQLAERRRRRFRRCDLVHRSDLRRVAASTRAIKERSSRPSTTFSGSIRSPATSRS